MAGETRRKTPFLPPRWVIWAAWHIHRLLYRTSGGRLGLRRPTAETYGLLRLTTVGRRTGKARTVMLGYYDDGPNHVTMAMNGWGAAEPAWWLNLQANPEADAHLVDGHATVRARAAEGEERDRLWARWQEIDDNLDAYAALRPAPTEVIVLEPVRPS